MKEHLSAREQILARYELWMEAIRRRDLDVVMSIYAPHATYMPPGKPKAVGSEAVRAVWSSYLRRREFEALYSPNVTLSDRGDMAYDVGTYRISMANEEGRVEYVGKYVVVWQFIGGEWKAVVDIDNAGV